ncbi:MAG: hypothetical protein LBC35_03150 [Coriobacteriales bacterium]|nr:hypothetical protein [Coriobacteriales bacterium]
MDEAMQPIDTRATTRLTVMSDSEFGGTAFAPDDKSPVSDVWGRGGSL